jgi:hypothetical protein
MVAPLGARKRIMASKHGFGLWVVIIFHKRMAVKGDTVHFQTNPHERKWTNAYKGHMDEVM